jgi:hypothetical protein
MSLIMILYKNFPTPLRTAGGHDFSSMFCNTQARIIIMAG